jgi:signal transduction histidine kinase
MRKLSIFFKLIAIVLLFGILLNISVILVFRVGLDPKPRRYFDAFIKRMEQYIVNDIGIPPDTLKAKQICDDLGIRMRFENRDFVWASDNNLPSLNDLIASSPHFSERLIFGQPFPYRYNNKTYTISPKREGVFIIEPLNIENIFSPEKAIATILVLISLIIIGLYFILRWLFKPMKDLSFAVKQIGDGNYNVEIPVKRKDELGELASSINDMSKKIEYSVKAKEQLLIDVSHELRTPLTRIKLGLEVNSPKEKINEDIIEMEGMISGLLESYRTGNYLGDLKKQNTNITDLLQDTVEGFLHNERMKFSEQPKPIFADIDAEKIETAFRNILDNALKYSTGEVVLTIKEQLNEVWVTFTDKGQGIKEEDLKYIFEPFYRADPSRSRKTGGFGLGLSICKKIIDAHDGEIKIESIVNEGTKVSIKLPLGAKN